MAKKPIRFQINRVHHDLVEGIGERIGKAALSSFSSIVIASPVKEGTFRGNWQVALNNPILTALNEVDLSGGGQTIRKYKPLFENYRLRPTGEASKIFFSNNMQYAKRLNEGWSPLAPSGFVEKALRAGLKNVNAGGRILKR